MEIHPCSIESLVERVEQYSKTSIELYRLKAIDRLADIGSSLASNLALITFFTLFFMIFNIGLALWVGYLLGKSYFGFFTVAAFYAVLWTVLFAFRNKWIKTPVRNSIISNALN